MTKQRSKREHRIYPDWWFNFPDPAKSRPPWDKGDDIDFSGSAYGAHDRTTGLFHPSPYALGIDKLPDPTPPPMPLHPMVDHRDLFYYPDLHEQPRRLPVTVDGAPHDVVST